MSQWEQDLLELGFRYAKAAHYQVRWAESYRAAAEAEGAAKRRQSSAGNRRHVPQGGDEHG